MSKLFWQILKAAPAVVGASALLCNGVVNAQTTNTGELLEQINQYNEQGDALEQVNSVTQFRDVSPRDWAYEALRGLVERYGCIAGYPNGTFRGNRALTRYEFAAGLYSCLTQIERLIAASTADFITRSDLQTLERLVQEFEAEIATLGTRVDNLEARTGFLEENQFSTTTKLKGEVLFSLADAFGDEEARADDGFIVNPDLDANTVFQDRVRLNFDSSFTGKDRLRVRLEAGNFAVRFRESGVTGTDMTRLGYESGGANDVRLNDLNYRFPVGERLRFIVGTAGTEMDDIFDVVNPVFESSGSGALSRFGRRNPAIYRTDAEGAGFGANIKLTDSIGLNLAYLSDGDAADPDFGIFASDYTAGAQLDFGLGDRLDFALTYARTFFHGLSGDLNLTGSTSSSFAKDPFVFGGPIDVEANRYGAQANFRVSNAFNVGGWVGYVDANADDALDSDAQVWNWIAHASLLDIGKEGSVFGVLFGMPPKLTDCSGACLASEDPDTSYLLEVQYRYPITDNILITPGAFAIFNPDHNDANDTIYVGVIRTTFKF